MQTTDRAYDSIEVSIDADLEELIPQYLANRHRDLTLLRQALAVRDFAQIRHIGHGMKGSGGGYGLDRITELGASIESAATKQDRDEVAGQAAALEDYLQRLKLTFE